MQLEAAATLARSLMDRYGLHDWALVFDRAKTRAGVCRFGAKQIGLSRELTQLHSDAEVNDTILHEIAHALVGPGHAHDAVWKRQAAVLGCTAQRCSSPTEARVDGPWVGTCPAGHVTTRHRRPERVLACRKCSPRFDVQALFEWTYRGAAAPMHPAYLAEVDELRRRARGAAAAADVRPDRAVALVGRPLLPEGAEVVIVHPGPFDGLRGPVVKRGRTRYHVVTEMGVVSVLAAMVRQL